MARRRTKPGSGTVLPRPSKEHGTVYQIRWRVNGGAAKYETVGPDRREAEQALALRLAQINEGSYREHRVASFHEFASDWFAGQKTRLRPSAQSRMRNDLEVHLVPFFGDYLLHQIGAELIERYVAAKVDDRKAGDARVAELEAELALRDEQGLPTGATRQALSGARAERGLSAVSINKTLTLLRQVLAAAVRYGYLDKNPVEHVRRLRTPKRIKPFLQLDQVALLVEAAPEAHRPLLLTLVQAGLRIGEALALRWRDVDLLADPPRLIITRTWDPQNRVEGPVKTGEEGEVTISQRLLEVLLDHKAASAFTADGDLVFPTRTGGHQNPSNFRRRVLAPAVERANANLAVEGRPPIPTNVTPHSLRHTFCSLLVAQGEDVAVAAAQMRHADPSTTLRVYTQVMQHSREGVAERLDVALWGGDGDSAPQLDPTDSEPSQAA